MLAEDEAVAEGVSLEHPAESVVHSIVLSASRRAGVGCGGEGHPAGFVDAGGRQRLRDRADRRRAGGDRRAPRPRRLLRTEDLQEAALERFAEFADAWGRKYPAIVKLWENAWVGVPPDEVRGRAHSVPPLRHREPPHRLHDENAIESVNAWTRRAVKARGHFPDEQAALQGVYMTIMSLDPTGKDQARWTMRWTTALNAFDIPFEGLLSAARQ
ncbi:conserved hypothetical protein [Streptomyces viridosporus ATCC 14672]|uniref:Mutator family transposase n=1 Tax=Streptomyces viridosporus (strain ATCC 14672 / DSM 40746 / JCM 4963 / KCTC 9882 / NRRL B-12104 / FH 1290) TaxID=566461 RepID=D5ZU86_STRV1|nr:conserved hypothetical protein [Streptomyces viridosporus ATCC 14672]